MSACTVKFMIKKSLSDPDNKAVFSQEIENPDTNMVYFSMSAEDTSKLKRAVYKAACKLFYESGTELTVWSGDIMVTQGAFNA